MGMVIHDDFWAAAQAMPEKQRAPFIYAIVEYRFTGKEPQGSPAWLPTFLVLKGRLDMGDEKSERARKAANARWGNRPGNGDAVADAAARAQDDAQARTGAYADADADAVADAVAYADADAHADASSCGNAEVEVEVEDEYIENPLIPFSEIVQALNDAAGTRYRASSAKTRSLIHARWAEGYRLPDFLAVIDTMAAEWKDDPKMDKYLRPSTLFSPKFEDYVNHSPKTRKGADGYDEYD
ncbi:conserved phage C-terminal domain-containing protein [uncultured Senegalimassilia sp.]|uniref:conserved phage C-terminal domain-containing protein n=1 Tax=uncultured Senegalimassilia sp. TaxID=1714350 RepID=UPI0025EECB8C|nr:conserved phage C-terminal domain-containing protein [uncultured Senegalimassilia sp.]